MAVQMLSAFLESNYMKISFLKILSVGLGHTRPPHWQGAAVWPFWFADSCWRFIASHKNGQLKEEVQSCNITFVKTLCAYMPLIWWLLRWCCSLRSEYGSISMEISINKRILSACLSLQMISLTLDAVQKENELLTMVMYAFFYKVAANKNSYWETIKLSMVVLRYSTFNFNLMWNANPCFQLSVPPKCKFWSLLICLPAINRKWHLQ